MSSESLSMAVRWCSSACACALLALVFCVQNAGASSTEVVRVMQDVDKNQDGKLSLAEIIDERGAPGESDVSMAKLQKYFKLADADRDGLIDSGELPTLLRVDDEDFNTEDYVQSLLARVDKNGDGKLSLAEILSEAESQGLHDADKAKVKTAVEGADVDGDGFVNREELPALIELGEGLVEKRFETADISGDGVRSRHELPALVELEEASMEDEPYANFLHMDSDQDGRLSFAELINGGSMSESEADKVELEQALNVADADSDGHISPTEMPVLVEFLDREKKDAGLGPLAVLSRMDRDLDGKLSVTEVVKGGLDKVTEAEEADLRERFKLCDKNGDGLIDVAELPALIASYADS